VQIFWMKRNLRIQDSEPFFQAMKSYRRNGLVLPLYCHEPTLIGQPDVSRQHQSFIRETLNELRFELQSIGGDLLEAVGESVDVFRRLHQESPISCIWTHRETTQNCQFERDTSVRQWCRENSVMLMEVEQNGIARGNQEPFSFPDYFSQSVPDRLRDPRGTDLSNRFCPLPFPHKRFKRYSNGCR
jgi:deoxyribodipyrimidine photo-lyase